MTNTSSNFRNPFDINFFISDVDDFEIQQPVEGIIEEGSQDHSLIEFEVNSFVNIDPTENDNDETAGGQDAETLENLIPTYRYSRDEVTRAIKACNYLVTRRGSRPSRVYWAGQIFYTIRRMLTEVVGLEHNSDQTVEAEADTYTLSRENFVNNLFWTKIDLTLFNDKQSERTINITYDEFEFVKNNHETFLDRNRDLIGKPFKSRIGNTRTTPKSVVDAFIFIFYTDELFR